MIFFVIWASGFLAFFVLFLVAWAGEARLQRRTGFKYESSFGRVYRLEVTKEDAITDLALRSLFAALTWPLSVPGYLVYLGVSRLTDPNDEA